MTLRPTLHEKSSTGAVADAVAAAWILLEGAEDAGGAARILFGSSTSRQGAESRI